MVCLAGLPKACLVTRGLFFVACFRFLLVNLRSVCVAPQGLSKHSVQPVLMISCLLKSQHTEYIKAKILVFEAMCACSALSFSCKRNHRCCSSLLPNNWLKNPQLDFHNPYYIKSVSSQALCCRARLSQQRIDNLLSFYVGNLLPRASPRTHRIELRLSRTLRQVARPLVSYLPCFWPAASRFCQTIYSRRIYFDCGYSTSLVTGFTPAWQLSTPQAEGFSPLHKASSKDF